MHVGVALSAHGDADSDKECILMKALTWRIVVSLLVLVAGVAYVLPSLPGVESSPLEIGRASCRERVCLYV